MKNQLLLSFVSLVLLVTGCAGPLPVVDEPTSNAKIPFQGDAFNQLKEKMQGYYDAYIKKAEGLRRKNQKASEVTFYSSLLGLIGGAAESVNTVIAGAVGAAGGSVYSDRYGLQVQASNYELAADAMLCMYFASEDITDHEMAGFLMDAQPAKSEATRIARDSMLRVKDKLYRLQAALELGKADITKLIEAIKASGSNVGKEGKGNEALTAPEEKTKAALREYKKEMDQCVAKITG